MLTDASPPYRWQDHVITPKRAASSLKATALIVAAIAVAAVSFDGHEPAPPAHAAMTTEHTPSLAHLAKRPVSPHPQSATAGAAALRGC
jgi:hypothetical protein